MKRTIQVFIAIIPFIVSFSTSDPTLSIRFLALSILVTGVLLYYIFTNRSIYSEVITHPAMIAFVIVIIAYIFSAFYNGFVADSIYTILKFYLLYVFTIIIIQFVIQEGYKSLLNSLIYFSLFLSFIYLYQLITSYSDIMSIESENRTNTAFNQIAGTMGHRNLFSSIQFLLLPILIYILTIGKQFFKILSGIAISLVIILIILIQTRAVLFAIVIFSFSLLLFNKKNLHRKHFIGIIVFFIIFLGGSYTIMKLTNRYDSFITEINRTLKGDSSGRNYLYNSSFQLIADNPLIGVGPGNWRIDIWKYGLYHGSYSRSFAQRPHNDFLWVFSEGGIFAGLSYILIFLILLKDSYYLHKNRKEEDGIFYSLLFSCFLGFGFISFFDFPIERFSHNIIFFTLASFIIAGKIKNPKNKITTSFKFLLISVSCFCVYVASIRYKGEIHTKNAISYKAKAKWEYVIKAIDKAYNKTYFKIENTSTPLLWYRGVAYFNQQKYNLAIKDFKEAYKVNPYHVHVLNNLATSYQVKGNSEKAKRYYYDALKMNPTFKETRVNLAAILYNESKYVEALDMILKSKVDAYWKRKANKDNYDLYLKTIVNKFINSIYIQANYQQKKVLDSWKYIFEKDPSQAATRTVNIFKIRQNDNIDYLTALLIYENNTTK